ncbi:MAG: TIM barrel protein [Verrucomicrobia bacterium]|nr:TIM barrel protein [Verrucomicrobiota bacterium]
MKSNLSRRSAIFKAAAGAAAVVLTSKFSSRAAAEEVVAAKLKGNINHSVCRGCMGKISIEDACIAGKAMGLVALDLVGPDDFPTLKKHGLVCAMVTFPQKDGIGGIPKGFNRLEHHDKLVELYEPRLKETADAGFPNLICFSGNRAGLDDEKGLENCALGLKRLMPLAEKLKVTLCMELLNSKRNHKDYQCDHSAWGVELAKRVGSERFKLLYDIFHMQIMEGDICDTIKDNHPYFAHYHTAGVPGRHEIDETQELNYPRIMKAIVDTGYKGYVAQEFGAKSPDRIGALRKAVQLCDV